MSEAVTGHNMVMVIEWHFLSKNVQRYFDMKLQLVESIKILNGIESILAY